MMNWNKLTDFLSSLKCSLEKKECLLIVAQRKHKQAIEAAHIEEIHANDNCTEVYIYTEHVAGQGDWITITI